MAAPAVDTATVRVELNIGDLLGARTDIGKTLTLSPWECAASHAAGLLGRDRAEARGGQFDVCTLPRVIEPSLDLVGLLGLSLNGEGLP